MVIALPFCRNLLAALIMALCVSTASAATAQGAAKPRSFKNCTAMNKVYAHGVGRNGASDKTSGTPVTNFKRSTRIYSHNDGGKDRHPGEHDLDRDNDGIACEKR